MKTIFNAIISFCTAGMGFIFMLAIHYSDCPKGILIPAIIISFIAAAYAADKACKHESEGR